MIIGISWLDFLTKTFLKITSWRWIVLEWFLWNQIVLSMATYSSSFKEETLLLCAKNLSSYQLWLKLLKCTTITSMIGSCSISRRVFQKIYKTSLQGKSLDCSSMVLERPSQNWSMKVKMVSIIVSLEKDSMVKEFTSQKILPTLILTHTTQKRGWGRCSSAWLL